MDHDSIYDVAIIGGGPAGLTAAIWLGRYLHHVAVIDSGDPRNWETRRINGFPAAVDVRPAELRGAERDECRRYDVELIDGCVARVRKESDERFVVDYDPIPEPKARDDRTGPGTARAPDDNTPSPEARTLVSRRLLLAFGLKDEWPKVPGLRQVYGATAHVCPDCDGYDARGKKVVVIASGRRAAGMALALTTWTREIVICTNGAPADLDEALCAKLDALNIPVLVKEIRRVEARGDQLYSVDLGDGMELDCAELFFSLSQRAADDLGAQLGCDRDERGAILIDARGHTSVCNVFAAGDITPGPQLAVTAAAEGAIAALAIHRSLVPAERKLERVKGEE